jgi:hypothetical protein
MSLPNTLDELMDLPPDQCRLALHDLHRISGVPVKMREFEAFKFTPAQLEEYLSRLIVTANTAQRVLELRRRCDTLNKELEILNTRLRAPKHDIEAASNCT